MKKLLTFILLGGISLLTSGMFADLTIPDADTYSFPYTDVNSTTSQSEINSVGDSENIPGMISAGMVTSERSLLTRLVNLFGLGGYTDNGVPSAIVYLQMIINLLL
ncbi:MAG: hypothetical protein LBD11_06795 [Candidatus Peribacteria bacterium]|jgi:hypothetical protein|nr:hypothetical protein [Candidatus Peribacteria bacterium]